MELQIIHSKIHTIRGQRVMLDFDLAELYEVPTKALNQAVKRNIERFPPDFMFQLDLGEWQRLRSQIVTLDGNWSQIVTTSKKFRGDAYAPFAFTEQGVAMLSGILRSPKAIQVNIAIMRAFVELRRYAITFSELAAKVLSHDKALDDVNEILKWLGEENQSRYNEIEAMKNEGEAKPPNEWDARPRIGFKKD